MACGQSVAMALLLDPEDESILRCRPGTPPWRLQGSDLVAFEGVLTGYRFIVGDLFATVRLD